MDKKNIRREIRRAYFSMDGLVFITILGIIGILMIYFSDIFIVKDLNMLYECVSKNGIMIIFGAFFFCVSLYCWGLFFLNIIISPKKEILYLLKNKKNEIFFVDKKGNRFECSIDKNNIEENNYYYVLKTHNYIYKVLEKTSENWIPKEKKSYWLNYYSPMGNFKDIFLLPIVYVILLPGILSFLMAKGYQKIYGLIYSIVPLYAIVYDLIYKIKLNKSSDNCIDDSDLKKSYSILRNTISIMGAFVLCIVFIGIFYKLPTLILKIVFLPFMLCGFCTVGLVISDILNNLTLKNLFLKFYSITFLIYWFGFLIFYTIEIVKQEHNYVMILFTIPFWIAGVFIFYKYIIKKKLNNFFDIIIILCEASYIASKGFSFLKYCNNFSTMI